jgi:DNA mismatch repair protein MutS2
MEPLSVVELNNKIKDLHFEEKREIEKILYKLSGMVWASAEMLEANLRITTQLDFIFAKGEMSLQMKATEPIFNDRGYINIRKGRHPLLNTQSVVPTDIYLGGEFSMLLITGPNTGGKTVTLKTVGLFTLMGQAGLHIPAFDNSELAVFSDVFADIGDEQSIEQSLSTFSSHMKNIVSILEKLTDNSLILLDELGAGTDPTEGAALAIAILNYLHDRQIRAVVTTHYSELKVYALATEGVENASCEFNVETLRPTYRLLIGIPGKSNAFAISRRLGLPEHIIDHAKTVLSQEDIRFEDMITDLEISQKTVLLEKDRAEQYRREAENLKSKVEAQQEKLDAQKERILREAKEEALRIVKEAKDNSDEMFKTFQRELRNQARQKGIEESRQAFRDKVTGMESEVAEHRGENQKLRPLPEKLEKGDKVYIHSLGQPGIVASPPDASGEVMVQAGIMKVKVNIANLSLDDTNYKNKKQENYNTPKASKSVKAGKALHISPELDMRGMMADEGIGQAGKYLDDAYLASLPQVTLIHGKGTGALRNAVRAWLKSHPHVKNFRAGTYGEGENGVTVVELK